MQSPSSDALGFGFYADSFRLSLRIGARFSFWYISLLAKLQKSVLPGFAILVRRAAFEAVGGFRANLAVGEDFAFTEDLRRLGFSVSLQGYPWVFCSVRRFEGGLVIAMNEFRKYIYVEVARLLGKKYLEGRIRYAFGSHRRSYERRFPALRD
jgi:hypothetical protein